MQTDSKKRQPQPEAKTPVMDESQSDHKDLHLDAGAVGSAEVVTEDKEKCVAVGVVTNCLKLNIREEPDPDAEILTVVKALTEVIVDTTASDEDFYKVRVDGIQGFCMKKFVALHR